LFEAEHLRNWREFVVVSYYVIGGGTIFIIIFFVSAAVYVIVGVIVKWRVYNAAGVELVPNTELWLGLPGLIRVCFVLVLDPQVLGRSFYWSFCPFRHPV
jgi:hypothetical protein